MSGLDAASAVGKLEYSILRRPDHEVVQQAVGLHLRSLGWSFLASFGAGVLTAVYEGLLREGDGCLVAALDGGRLRGYILASARPTPLVRIALRSPLRLASGIVRGIARDPSVVPKLIGTLAYGRKTRTDGVEAELVVIAVDPAVRSRGVGARLVAELDRELLSRGVRAYKVTVHASMQEANAFYRGNGFGLARTFTQYGVEWNLYVREPTGDR